MVIGSYHPQDEEGRRFIQEGVRLLLDASMPILQWDVFGTDETPSAFVAVDASQHPEVSDLIRVHRLEGPRGDIQTYWTLWEEPSPAILSAVITSPVTATFHVVFRIKEHAPLLTAAQKAAWLSITVGSYSRDEGGVLQFQGFLLPVPSTPPLVRPSPSPTE